MKRSLILIITIIIYALETKAKIGGADIFAGGGINSSAYLTANGGSSGKGFNIRGGINFGRKIGLVVGFNKSNPISFTSSEYAEAYSSWTTPFQISYEVVHRVTFYDLNVRANLFIAGTGDRGVGFYGHVGVGFLAFKDKREEAAYDKKLYSGHSDSGGTGSSAGGIVGGGLGLQYRYAWVAAFLEGGINIPITQVNEGNVNPVAALSAGATLGLKIYFGKSTREPKRKR